MQISTAVDYIERLSYPLQKQFVFYYHVIIKNTGTRKAQLLRRHWLITNGDGEQQIVKGDGVIGEQPILAAESMFSYSSSVVLSTPFGIMQGYYEFCAADGDEFKANIPLFRLGVPNILQ